MAMTDPRVDAVAKVLVEYSVDVKPGQLVRITGAPEGTPLILAVYRNILAAGGHPYLNMGLEETSEILLRFASDAQLDYLPSFSKTVVETIDAEISVWTDSNTRHLSSIDPARMSRRVASRRELNDRYLERVAKKELRWVGTQYPTNAVAQDADMSLVEFEEFLYGSCRVDEKDPIAAWRKVSKKQARLVDYLSARSRIHVVGPDTDLRLTTKGRLWENCDGHENFPDGEVFTGPIEESVEGTIRYTFPACYYGHEVEDVRLTFKKGKVVEASAAKNEGLLKEMLDVDEGARFVGEFAFGTNPGIQRFTKNTLFDEKIGGTIHLALGKGFPETGSKNSSAIHWDMVCDLRQGGRVEVDGETFMEDGKFLVE
jgi:aminopeptidase